MIAPTCDYCSSIGKLIEYDDGCNICTGCYKDQMSMVIQFRKQRTNKFPQMDEIVQGIFLGNQDAASDKKLLQAHNITAICVCGSNLQTPFEEDPQYAYLKYEIDDFPKQRIINLFPSHYEWMQKMLEEKRRILLHCAAGVSRSASFTIAFLMKQNKMNYEEAKQHVKSKRKCIMPNTGFRQQLKDYQALLQKQ